MSRELELEKTETEESSLILFQILNYPEDNVIPLKRF